MARKKWSVWGVFLVGMVLLTLPARAQFLGNPVAFSGKKTWALGISAGYQKMDWKPAAFRAKGALGRLSYGVTNGLDLYLLGGYRDLNFSEKKLVLSDCNFGTDYAAGGGVRLRLLGTKSTPLTVHAFAEGLYFAPATYFEKPAPGRPVGTLQRSYVYVEAYTPCGGLVTTFRLKRVDFFLGATATYFHSETRREDYLISIAGTHRVQTRRLLRESPVFEVLSAGLDFKLPQGYRIGLEIQNSTAPGFCVLVGISQIGHLKD